MFKLKIESEIKTERHPDMPNFDSPHNSKWIVSVDIYGNVSVINAPNLCDGLIESDGDKGVIGFPCDSESDPGVYEWICSYTEHVDWESGHVDDFDFDVIEEKLLWEPL